MKEEMEEMRHEFPDGSFVEKHSAGTTHSGSLAVTRVSLITAVHALKFNVNTGHEVTRNGSKMAVDYVANSTGKVYKRSKKGKSEAMQDAQGLVAAIEMGLIVGVTDMGEFIIADEVPGV